jgi:hypothetical protein
MKILLTSLLSAALCLSLTLPSFAAPLVFPQITATPSEVCGGCHKAIYNEFAHGFGADIH